MAADFNATFDQVIDKSAAPSATMPLMDGEASPGTESEYARGNHRHPTDTTRQAKIDATGILKGDGSGGVSAAVAGTDYADPSAVPTASAATPLMDGEASPGTGTEYALGNHRHPTDDTRQAEITAAGILKGDGNGGVTAAQPGVDYLAPVPAPIKSAYDLPCFYTGAIRIHAHQGTSSTTPGSDLIPEGLNAFEEAGKKRAFICEADIRQTADGYLVCMHNDTVDATTDGTGAVASLTLAQIRALRLKRNDGTISDQQVPTIDEYLKICKKYGMIAAMELKAVRTAGFTAKVAAKVSEYGMEGQSFLITQVANAATYVRSVTDLPLMMIVIDSNWDASFAYAQANDNIIFTFAKTATTDIQEKINACHAIGVPCNIHVVNQKSEAETYFDMGADIITSDLLTEGDWLEANT